ncbi:MULTISPECIES: 6-hydroxymethylpterin diphosphokinase MptE-like protein [Methanothermobacter]|uniref:6-hydroxymethyl-7,8-dihydropterin pyrophosphokinase n=2 Tax=Methanothermobacter TaxID=145260 RepID=MPTE_METTH|nr:MULTISPECIES: 6-hydroxymethylpterin diphosphokinase MptE-like protein [Methanothermobacter]O27637.1 RecName: Full=6-hydroxymethyl-7,8-dihydropterin pyrophosphokinase; Short=HPPK; AltName: Full=2-amino-4-hydroxy-6-hydroxymethyldihydropteridine pyrophosphokinase; AltName: Full=6-hydroxymethyl-7,8-dihydropterin diphosphokinase; Short=6-HMPDK; AltName: Full=7,8-dihydro-6-hydroxymethylpterin diphosphokinase; AltName: Full=7,8-dihydro-6-hydroxymethylpterin pyrophosphokinase; Short=PPPK [Methanothermo
MEVQVWLRWYTRILDDFGFDRRADEESASYLDAFLREHGCLRVDDIDVPSSDFIVFGAGPSLRSHLKRFRALDEPMTVISADGATTALLEEDVLPDIIVTDLDGKMEDIIEANRQGAVVVVHAHGNNLPALRRYLPLLQNIIGTTQSIPHGCLHNFGGFTDGDRAVFLAAALGAGRIVLAGMDFGEVVTRYSRPDMDSELGPADPVKRLKLEYASRLIDWLERNGDVRIERW